LPFVDTCCTTSLIADDTALAAVVIAVLEVFVLGVATVGMAFGVAAHGVDLVIMPFTAEPTEATEYSIMIPGTYDPRGHLCN